MEESCQEYDSVHEMMQSMPCELEGLGSSEISNHCFTVWRSKNNDELGRLLAHSAISNMSRGTGLPDMNEIKFWLEFVCMKNYLFQFWAPVTIGDKRFLTTSDQPFALAQPVKGLCSYRKHCLDILIPINDTRTEEGHPPARVFQNDLPEVCLDVRRYTCKEYPERDYAVTCGIRCYLAFPLYKFSGVIELVADAFQPEFCKLAKLLLRNSEATDDNDAFRVVADYIRSVSFANDRGSCPDMMSPAAEIEQLLRAVCKTHHLPLAQAWVSMPYSSRYKDRVKYEERGSYITHSELSDFAEACSTLGYIRKGQGVVGKAFSSKGACFCQDVTQLSINEYSLVPSARTAGLTGSFAISLRDGNSFLDYVYIVELFLPSNDAASGDPRALTKKLLATMKEHLVRFQVTSRQELGEDKLFLEVIKTSPTDEIHYFETCDLTGIDSTTVTLVYGGEPVHLDNIISNVENILGRGGDDVAYSGPQAETGRSMLMEFSGTMYDNPVFPEKIHWEGMDLVSDFPPILDPNAGKALDNEEGANVLPDAINQDLQHGMEAEGRVDARSHAENVNNAEQYFVRTEQCTTNNMGEIVQLDDAIGNEENMNVNSAEQNALSMEQLKASSMAGSEIVQMDDAISNVENMNVNCTEQNVVSREQRDTDSNISKNQRTVKRIHREYGITRADLLQHSAKKQKDAAAHFRVSRSTFKRICREHQIFRWPPRREKRDGGPSNGAQGLVQSANEIMKDSFVEQLPQPVEQELNSNPDSTQNAMAVENDSSIVVKVTYRNNMIKFYLSVSSGKMALEEEIAMRFRLSIGSFDIKYLDEDEDWISVTCDADLNMCMSIMRSSGKNSVKMLVNLSQEADSGK